METLRLHRSNLWKVTLGPDNAMTSDTYWHYWVEHHAAAHVGKPLDQQIEAFMMWFAAEAGAFNCLNELYNMAQVSGAIQPETPSNQRKIKEAIHEAG